MLAEKRGLSPIIPVMLAEKRGLSPIIGKNGVHP
jgi:hypothetical protein